MRFEWDENKSIANEEKHGVPLSFGCAIWNARLATFSSRRKGEDRKLSIGIVNGEYWSAIWTQRDDAVRLISVRLSTLGERSCYDRHNS